MSQTVIIQLTCSSYAPPHGGDDKVKALLFNYLGFLYVCEPNS